MVIPPMSVQDFVQRVAGPLQNEVTLLAESTLPHGGVSYAELTTVWGGVLDHRRTGSVRLIVIELWD